MTSYRDRRIEDLKHTVMQAFEKVPPDCQSMSMDQYSSWVADYYSNEAIKKNPGRLSDTYNVVDVIRLRDAINGLVDMGKLDFDESTPLCNIVKILGEK